MGLVVQPRPTDVRRGRVVEELFLDGVLAEPGDRGQPPGDGGAGPPAVFELPGEGPDVGAAHREQGRDRARHQAELENFAVARFADAA